MRRLFVALVCLGGCGRLHFDGEQDAADAFVPPECPAGYVWVAADTRLQTPDFCVMQFEPRDSAGVPTSVPEGAPWANISATAAYAACASLGPAYSLISNAEWMAIARSGERTAENWIGDVGTGVLVEGRSRGGSYPDDADITDPLANTTGDPDQRRTLVLENGNAVWDLAGNMQEWVDFHLGPPLDSAPACTSSELDAIQCMGYAYDDYNSESGTLNRANGAGYIIGGSGTALRRGGQDGDHANGFAGIYGFNVNRDVSDTFPATTFRCVYRL